MRSMPPGRIHFTAPKCAVVLYLNAIESITAALFTLFGLLGMLQAHYRL
jgi:hypothetical protein